MNLKANELKTLVKVANVLQAMELCEEEQMLRTIIDRAENQRLKQNYKQAENNREKRKYDKAYAGNDYGEKRKQYMKEYTRRKKEEKENLLKELKSYRARELAGKIAKIKGVI